MESPGGVPGRESSNSVANRIRSDSGNASADLRTSSWAVDIGYSERLFIHHSSISIIDSRSIENESKFHRIDSYGTRIPRSISARPRVISPEFGPPSPISRRERGHRRAGVLTCSGRSVFVLHKRSLTLGPFAILAVARFEGKSFRDRLRILEVSY